MTIYFTHNNLLWKLFKYLKILISAQQEGSLSEATSPETDQTDPFYAHCKLHVDKMVAKLVYLSLNTLDYFILKLINHYNLFLKLNKFL